MTEDELVQNLHDGIDAGRNDGWSEDDIVAECHQKLDAMVAELAQLREARERHLALIRKISQTVPLESEAAGALEQRGALLAEIGTLKAKIEELKNVGVPSCAPSSAGGTVAELQDHVTGIVRDLETSLLREIADAVLEILGWSVFILMTLLDRVLAYLSNRLDEILVP